MIDADIDESPQPAESPVDYVRRVAMEKARAGCAKLGAPASRPLLAADTVVVCGGQILGKPRDREDAAQMLRLLSGRRHRVLTAVTLTVMGEAWQAYSESQVTLRILSETDICRYWQTGEPEDKAGGYAIQGHGALFITRLDGSYSGVMGLPLCETGSLLERAGIELMSPTVFDTPRHFI